jgi:hypothetical protein
MTKLVKASTALKRAEAVDQGQLALDAVVKTINSAVSLGLVGITEYIGNEHEVFIVQSLEKAGYKVTYPQHEAVLRLFGTEKAVPERNWFQRLFGASTDDVAEFYQPITAPRGWEEITISWAKEEVA